ncbi:unnamed protein product, partial [Rotaria magnacalcarata]
KSTCISLLLHYYDPSSGEILINGQSISEYDIKQLRLNIGVVNQDPILFSTTIYENISYGKENSTKYQIEQAARQANAHDFIMKLPNKYSTLVGEAGIQLSFGEKQRIALARALVRQPQLLLLDEATSGLDCQNEYIIQQALNNICKDRTTVIVAHRLTTIQNADYIYFTAFSVAGSKLTERIRTKAFASLLRQEVAYFDQSENSSGAICHRLSSDALSIQQITSTRLGYICKTLAMFMLGIIFGFLFNYQFSLIVLFMLFIVAAFTYLNIIFEMRLHKKCGNILRQASSISVEVLHNMRTVKLLSMEERFVNDLGDIQFDHVKFSYPCRPTSTVVNILKLIIKSGQKVAFVDQIINAAKKANIHNFIQELPQGYQTNVGIKGNQLSGGEKQRIAIARAIIREPNLLIFDEATSDLDSYNEQIVQQTLEHIQIENPLQTTITIAHRLGTIRSCHQIYVIDKGHIIESGSHEELIQRRSRYYQMILLNRLQ